MRWSLCRQLLYRPPSCSTPLLASSSFLFFLFFSLPLPPPNHHAHALAVATRGFEVSQWDSILAAPSPPPSRSCRERQPPGRQAGRQAGEEKVWRRLPFAFSLFFKPQIGQTSPHASLEHVFKIATNAATAINVVLVQIKAQPNDANTSYRSRHLRPPPLLLPCCLCASWKERQKCRFLSKHETAHSLGLKPLCLRQPHSRDFRRLLLLRLLLLPLPPSLLLLRRLSQRAPAHSRPLPISLSSSSSASRSCSSTCSSFFASDPFSFPRNSGRHHLLIPTHFSQSLIYLSHLLLPLSSTSLLFLQSSSSPFLPLLLFSILHAFPSPSTVASFAKQFNFSSVTPPWSLITHPPIQAIKNRHIPYKTVSPRRSITASHESWRAKGEERVGKRKR